MRYAANEAMFFFQSIGQHFSYLCPCHVLLRIKVAIHKPINVTLAQHFGICIGSNRAAMQEVGMKLNTFSQSKRRWTIRREDVSKDNYDDLADFCGPKGFYDLDGEATLTPLRPL